MTSIFHLWIKAIWRELLEEIKRGVLTYESVDAYRNEQIQNEITRKNKTPDETKVSCFNNI